MIREILDRRGPAAPRAFVATQIGRLNEALLVAFSAMGTSPAGLRAVDRVIRIVRELDRYHGFGAGVAPRRRPPSRRPAQAPDDAPDDDAPGDEADGCFSSHELYARVAASFGVGMSVRAEFAERPQNPAQGFETMDFAPEAAPGFRPRGEAAPDPVPGAALDPAPEAAPEPARIAPAPDEAPAGRPAEDSRPQNPPQALEAARSAPSLAEPAEAGPEPTAPPDGPRPAGRASLGAFFGASLGASLGAGPAPAAPEAAVPAGAEAAAPEPAPGPRPRPQNPAQPLETTSFAPGRPDLPPFARAAALALRIAAARKSPEPDLLL